MRAKIRGHEWSLRYVKKVDKKGHRGEADISSMKIKVKKGMSSLDTLEVTLHELLHAAYWDLDEEAITEAARDISKVLHRLGYRRR